ncbi:hypothetical protein [Actinokineospora fastidiosa]|uniref:Glycosyltransferase RgtA/B/C/D-like domain-containing protein n=1 Tax=Actinokineospora fastidiosa TaxID=1816 RepID=A0A918L9I6_9PSEU|nr:hypothetical protein [Actinokineospora fastidiosa]GGS21597.1 hypothetical protein GCM10010171_12910 [Actinokineospora fastidiosa]
MLAATRAELRGPAPRATVPWWRTATALACVLGAIRVAVVAAAPYPQAVGLFDDDAFYYFGVARHIAEGDGSTFNGIDPTNGYHPLWLLALVPVFSIADSHTALVAVSLLSFAVLIGAARQIDRIGALTARPVLTLAWATPLLVTGTAGPSFFFSGMETGLLLLGLLWLAATWLASDGFTAPWFGVGAAVATGTLMALTVLARLDAVFPMALLGVLALVTWRRKGLPWTRLGVAVAAVPALTLATYLAVNLAVFDTPLPVSGQAKALGGGLNPGVVGQFLVSPVVFGVPTLLGVAALVVVIAAVLRGQPGLLGRSAQFGAVVLGGGVLTVAYYALTSSWQLWPWYFSAAPLAVALAGPAVAAGRTERLPLRGLATGVLAVLTVAAAGITAARAASGGVERSAFIEAGPAAARQIDALLPLGAPIAMGDRAGSVGYHLHRPLVHLEGLVNSAEYLDAMRAGTVGDFLAERGVALYARGDADPGEPVPERPGCHRFTEPQQGGGVKFTLVVCDRDLVLTTPLSDGTSYRVWLYRAEPPR